MVKGRYGYLNFNTPDDSMVEGCERDRSKGYVKNHCFAITQQQKKMDVGYENVTVKQQRSVRGPQWPQRWLVIVEMFFSCSLQTLAICSVTVWVLP